MPVLGSRGAAEASAEAVLLPGTARGEFTPGPQQQAAPASCCRKREKRGPRRGQRCLHSLPACRASRNAAKSITVPPRQEIADASHSLWQNPSAGLKWKLQRSFTAQRTSTPFSAHRHNALLKSKLSFLQPNSNRSEHFQHLYNVCFANLNTTFIN